MSDLSPEIMSAVKDTRQKAEEFVASISDGDKGPIAIMAMGMIAGQMLGEYAAKAGLAKTGIEELIDGFCQAFALDVRRHYNK